MKYLSLLLLLLMACGDDSAPADTGVTPQDAGDDSATDAGATDAGDDAPTMDDAGDLVDAGDDATDAMVSCIEEGREVGERVPVGDDCNFCECQADGTYDCTDRSCTEAAIPGCEYDGVMHEYGVRFDARDGCNVCVCAASGLACTRRTETCTDTVDEGAILLESLDEECGVPGFTPDMVLSTLPHDELNLPFIYERVRDFYPESLADTEITVRILRDQDGYAVCRIPNPNQEAIDMEVLIEWYTEDGSFDETFHAYLRRNAGGFTNVWTLATSLPAGALNGSYTPGCPGAGGLSFNATIDFDGSATGAARKVCEVDLSFVVGSFTLDP